MSTEPSGISDRKALASFARESRGLTLDLALRLVSIPSPNPPGDTRAVAAEILKFVEQIPGAEAKLHVSAEGVHNVVAVVKAQRPGRRLILNGHLDTFPLAGAAQWTVSPNGCERDGRIYGLGISDMKGGIAASLVALRNLALCRSIWSGEVVATFAGDEETMGVLGTQYLIDHVAEAKGDAVICADVGSPRVLRVGEKGLIWLRLTAKGRSSHAAHVHRGDSAIDKLLVLIARLSTLRHHAVALPAAVEKAIAEAKAVSEPLSGEGESRVLRSMTVTFGTISGGQLPNLVSDHAEATTDIRLPMGTGVSDIKRIIEEHVASVPGTAIEWVRAYEPSWTSPEEPIVQAVANGVREVTGERPVVNMRIGASDSRLYRAAGIPTVVCGLTPNNMGAPDEHVEADELMDLSEVLTLAVFDYLNR